MSFFIILSINAVGFYMVGYSLAIYSCEDLNFLWAQIQFIGLELLVS